MPDIPFIVPFGRDGAADRAARAFAASWSPPRRRGPNLPGPNLPGPNLPGPNLLIENHPGSGGLLGVHRANALARSGNPVLLLATPSTHILLPARLGPTAEVDAEFKPVIGLGSAPNVLLASPGLGIRTVAELIARASTGKLVYASAGTGQTIHVCTALFCAQAGIAMTHRPYDAGSAAAYDDLIAGRVHVYFDNLLGCRDRIERGDAVALAVSSTQRARLLPTVPTLIESGFPGHALDVWLAVFGAHVASTPADDALLAELEGMGLSGGPVAGDRLSALIDDSGAMWRRAVELGLPR